MINKIIANRLSYKFLLTGVIYIMLGSIAPLVAQDFLWKANVRSFFDNYEFADSKYQESQTMAGVRFAPEIGLSWEGKHRIYAGIDLLHEWGSNNAIDGYDPVAYYEYDSRPFRLYVGAFPRRTTLDRYPRMFFSDSILDYRPNLNGIFLEYALPSNGYANLWLDWTSRQTQTRHEAFFMGWSGQYNAGILSFRHLGYMFHFASVADPQKHTAVHDNGLTLTSVGVDLADLTGFKSLNTSVGWAIALDRNRQLGVWNTPQGLLWETRIGYKFIELFNTYYRGGRQQVDYDAVGTELYWGERTYRASEYDRLDLSVHFIRTNVVDVKATYSLHFMERNMFHQQTLYASFNLANIFGKKH